MSRGWTISREFISEQRAELSEIIIWVRKKSFLSLTLNIFILSTVFVQFCSVLFLNVLFISRLREKVRSEADDRRGNAFSSNSIVRSRVIIFTGLLIHLIQQFIYFHNIFFSFSSLLWVHSDAGLSIFRLRFSPRSSVTPQSLLDGTLFRFDNHTSHHGGCSVRAEICCCTINIMRRRES